MDLRIFLFLKINNNSFHSMRSKLRRLYANTRALTLNVCSGGEKHNNVHCMYDFYLYIVAQHWIASVWYIVDLDRDLCSECLSFQINRDLPPNFISNSKWANRE